MVNSFYFVIYKVIEPGKIWRFVTKDGVRKLQFPTGRTKCEEETEFGGETLMCLVNIGSIRHTEKVLEHVKKGIGFGRKYGILSGEDFKDHEKEDL